MQRRSAVLAVVAAVMAVAGVPELSAAGAVRQPAGPAVRLATVPPVPAGAKQVARVRPTTMTDRWTGAGTVRATLRLRGLPPNQVHSLVGTVVAGSPNQESIALGNKITCAVPGQPITQLWNGTNLVAGRPDVTLRIRLLVTVPASGAVDCSLRAYVSSHVGRLGATARLFGGWLADIGSAGWVPTTVQLVLTRSSNPLVALNGRPLVVSGIVNYLPPTWARGLTVTGDVYLTECHRGGNNSCPRGGQFPAFGITRAITQVVANPRRPGCATRISAPASTVIDSAAHHKRAESTLTLPVAGPACGAWDISLRARTAGGTSPYVVHEAHQYSAFTVRPVR